MSKMHSIDQTYKSQLHEFFLYLTRVSTLLYMCSILQLFSFFFFKNIHATKALARVESAPNLQSTNIKPKHEKFQHQNHTGPINNNASNRIGLVKEKTSQHRLAINKTFFFKISSKGKSSSTTL